MGNLSLLTSAMFLPWSMTRSFVSWKIARFENYHIRLEVSGVKDAALIDTPRENFVINADILPWCVDIQAS